MGYITTVLNIHGIRTMRDMLLQTLMPIRRRQRLMLVLQYGTAGLLLGAIAAAILATGRLLEWWTVSSITIGASVGVGLMLGFVVGLVVRRGWQQAASVVDTHYQFKDRSATALEFTRVTEPTTLQSLQIADALTHLQTIEPRRVVPFQVPRTLGYALVCCVGVIVLMLIPLKPRPVQAGPQPAPEHIVAEAEQLQESLRELDELIQESDDPELEKLLKELKEKANEMKQEGVDEKEALAKLSEMETAIQAKMAQYNTAVVDGQMQSLGNALSMSPAFEGAGKALQEGDLEKAKAELEQLDAVELERNEAKALKEKLEEVAKKMGEAGLGSLSNASAELSESLQSGKSKAGKACDKMAREIGKHAKRKSVCNLLNAKLDELKECKCNCQSNSLVEGLKKQKSTNPSNNYGKGTSGNTQGEKTARRKTDKDMNLTGTPGDGPSEVETTSSPEARQQATRGTQESYAKYKKMSEEVLDSEPIPLGYRQMIRQYFELIRPENADK